MSSTRSPAASGARAGARIDALTEKLIVRVDRTDPSKNIVRGFRAFELFLEEHPGVAPAASTMLALLDPSRQDDAGVRRVPRSDRAGGAEVNDRFAAEDWLPVDLQVADNFPQSVAAYKQYDVLLVNAVFDGLNLVAKEAPLVNERDGVLVLSENAGAHEELGAVGADRQPVRRGGPGGCAPRGADMPPAERRRARRACGAGADARHRGLDGGAARRLRRGPGAAQVA